MQPSLPSPISSYMTSSFGRTEVPQAVLLTICYWSSVSHVISVHVTKTLFISHLKVHLRHSYVFLHSVSKLTIVSSTLFLLEFFSTLYSQLHLLFLCVFYSHLQHALSKFDHFPELCLVSHCHFSFLLSSHPHSTFFFSISICHVCVSVPVLFLLSIPRGSYIQRLQSFLLLRHFCCSQAVSCCFVMFGGKVPLKCCRASLQRERQVCVHMGDGGVLNSLLCAF